MTRVLVVDDEQGLRVLVGAILKSASHDVVEAEDGEDALDILRDYPIFDLIITDIHMAPMDGLRFLAELQRRYPTIPVIISSVSFRYYRVDPSQQLGAAAFLPRPFTPPQLLELVERIMGNHARKI
jgi:two-component system chemotaxis response regulator CheY